MFEGAGGPLSDLIDTTEMYLKTIFELEEEGVTPLRARIAERLHQSGPTVSQTVARMERDGLLRVDEDRHLELTKTGRVDATRVMRKHRLVERLLVDVIGLEWELVHNEACRWEHVVSDAVEKRLADLLHDPATDPYGNPIPGLTASGAGARGTKLKGTRLTELDSGETQARLACIGEPLQVDEKFLSALREADLLPGNPVRVSVREGEFGLSGTADVNVTEDNASHVFVNVQG